MSEEEEMPGSLKDRSLDVALGAAIATGLGECSSHAPAYHMPETHGSGGRW